MNSTNQIDLESESDSSSNSTSSQTDYILGFDDGKIKKKSDLLEFNISKIGGTPVFLPLNSTIIPHTDLVCLICQKSLPLLVQIYCPSLQHPSHDRVLYLFGCPDEKCQTESNSKSVRGFKSWKFNQEYHQQSTQFNNQVELEVGENPFKLNKAHNEFENSFDNPFIMRSDTGTRSKLNLLDNSFSELSLSSPSSVEKANQSLVDNFPVLCSPPHYLTTSYELKPKSGNLDSKFKDLGEQMSSGLSKKKKTLLEKKEKKASHDQISCRDVKFKYQHEECYEVQTVKGVDQVFLDFQERINWNDQSSQIVRYNPTGRALLVKSKLPTASISRLKCGHETKFELQIMPASLKFFNKSMNWTTVWMNDCMNDCIETDEGWVEIECFVQSVD